MNVYNLSINYLALALVLVTIIPSCSHYNDYSNGSFDNDASWVNQLQSAIDSQKESGDSLLKLVDYQYRCKITSREVLYDVINEIFDDNAVIAFGEIDNVHFTTIGKIKQPISTASSSHQVSLNDYLEKGTDVVDLTWSYKGLKYTSVAIVSDKDGFIYDNIGSHVISKTDIISKPVTKSGDFPDDSISAESHSASWCLSGSRRDFLNLLLYSYSLSCTSTFDNSGTLINIHTSAENESHLGWSCAADVRTVSGTLYESNFHQFSWAYAYGLNCTVSLSYNGVGFSIPLGSTGASGSCVHTLADTGFPADTLLSD